MTAPSEVELLKPAPLGGAQHARSHVRAPASTWRRAALAAGCAGIARSGRRRIAAGACELPEWVPGKPKAQAELPLGFKIATQSLKFVPEEAQEMGELPMRLTVISLEEPTDRVAAVFTSNAFPGAPVRVGRRRMAESGKLQAVVINNKISNVSPPDSDGGVSASETLCAELAKQLSLESAELVLPSSTGVIGWRLPVKEMVAALPQAEDLATGSAVPAAKGIMTTDRYPKLAARELSQGRLVGIAKGAGMIEPNMATMLCFLLTDVDLPRTELQTMLTEAVADTFNCISVDGDESTSDTVALLSSGQAGPVPKEEFQAALQAVCADLAAQVVRNGEGTGHVIRVAVTGGDTPTARSVAKAVANGPLFKSAIAGNDPNVGRLIGKVGQALGSAASLADGCVCRIGGETIFAEGQFQLDTEKEKRLSGHLKFASADCESSYPQHRRVVDVEVMLGGGGSGKAVVLGSDLTTEYVKINADYRS
ncbi:unnamed protein product [Effrenium voratum]|nr:unnamed protein product [Effrenium voratum]